MRKPYPRTSRNVGATNPKAKLDDAKVREVRRLAREGMRVKDIAEKFGITPPTTSSVILRRTWKHVSKE